MAGRLFLINASVAAAAPFLAKQSVNKEHVSVTITTTNDVYSMYARPFSGNSYYFDGTPSDEFYSMCEKDGDNCFGTAAALGMPEASVDKLYNLDMPATGGKLLDSEDSGCVTSESFDAIVRDPMAQWGNTAQMAGTYKYLGETADTDAYFSVLPGDFVAMSYLSMLTHGAHMVDMMNAAEIDLVAFGNHEFQFKNQCPEADLDSHPEWKDLCMNWNIATSNFMYLGANVFADEEKTILLGSELKVNDTISFVNASVPKNEKVFGDDATYAPSGQYWSKMVEGKKLCFAGTTETSAAASIVGKSNVWLSEDIEATVAATREMNQDGCNLVIVMTHMREGMDVLFWRDAVVKEGLKVDAILAAHDHFPAFMTLRHPTNPDIVTPLWKMGMDGQLLGKFVFDFDAEHPDGKLRYAHAIPVFDGQCDSHFVGTDNEEWWNNNVMQTWSRWVEPIKPLAETEMENLLFKGLYNTADIRLTESRVGNMLADLFIRNMSVNVAALDGGNIRYGLSQVYNERVPLTELDLYSENPFPDGLVAYDISLMELFGFVFYSAPIAMGGSNAARPVTAGFEVEMDPTTQEHNGVTLIRFTGTSHMAGIVNRTQTACGHPTLKCGEIIWDSVDGWKVDPYTMISIAAPQYNARYSSNDAPTLRRSYYLTQMTDLCRRGAENYAMDLNGESQTFACPPGPDFFGALDEQLPWSDCGYVQPIATTTPGPSSSPTSEPEEPAYTPESIKAADSFCSEKSAGSYCKYWQGAAGLVCHGSDVECAHLLVPTTRQLDATAQTCWAQLGESLDKRSVIMWSEEDVTPAGVPVVDPSFPIGTGSAVAARALAEPWLVGGEEIADLEKYGIDNVDVESMQMANLPVRRWLKKEPKVEATGFVLASMGETPKKTVGEYFGAGVSLHTILALH